MHILNSLGHSWEVTGNPSTDTQSIQSAIDELPDDSANPVAKIGGMVKLPSAIFQTTDTITLRTGVFLDMQRAVIKPDSDFDVLYMGYGNRVMDGTIDVSDVNDFSSACIFYDGKGRIGAPDGNDYCQRRVAYGISNMKLLSDGNGSDGSQRGTGILYRCDGTGSSSQCVMMTRIENITTYRFQHGLDIDVTYASTTHSNFVNMHFFKNLTGIADRYFIYQIRNWTGDVSPGSESTGCAFRNLYCDATSGNYHTEKALYSNCNQNSFTNFIVHNFAGSGVAWHFDYEEGSPNGRGYVNYLSCNGPRSKVAIDHPWNILFSADDGKMHGYIVAP